MRENVHSEKKRIRKEDSGIGDVCTVNRRTVRKDKDKR